MLPWDSPYDKDGNLVPHRYSGWVNTQQNQLPIRFTMNYSESKYYEFMGSLDFDIKITDWLTFSSVNNYKYINSTSHGYSDPRSSSGEINGRLTEWRAEVTRRYTNQKLLINKDWQTLYQRIDSLREFNDYYYKNLDVYGTGLYPDLKFWMVSKPERTKRRYQRMGYSVLFHPQWKYVYDGKYIAEASIRRDGASNLGATNAKYGNLLSGSVGWIISREDWFDVDWIDNPKLRGGYGTVGNRPSSLYPQYDLYSVSSSYNENSGALISVIGNKDLTWEKTYTTSIGLDAALFNNRLRFTLISIQKTQTTFFIMCLLRGLTGGDQCLQEYRQMKNTGYEISLGGDIISTKDWFWNVELNIGHNSNKLKDLYKQKDTDGSYVVKPVIISDGSSIAGTAQRILEIGYPVDTYYLKEWAGVNPENGAPMWYKDTKDSRKAMSQEEKQP